MGQNHHISIPVFDRVLVVFVDAFGPHQLDTLGAGLDELPHRRALTGTMGYSSGALPTILTGVSPAVHGRMCLFSAPERERSGVLTPLSWLGLLPRLIHERPRVRAVIARVLARTAGLTGYVALHRVPPKAFKWLDLPEREDLFRASDIGGAATFLADVRRARLDVYAAPWQLGEDARWRHAHDTLAARPPRLAFLYTAALDGALHRHGNDPRYIAAIGARIAHEIARARAALASGGKRVLTLVVGDHGMADVDRLVDPRPCLDRVRNCRVFVDSTMMRFWGDEATLDRCRRELERLRAPGRWLDQNALCARGVPTRDAPYGNSIFLLEEGALFAPSFLGNAVRGMHGYDTTSTSSRAALASDVPIPVSVQATADIAGYVRAAVGLDQTAAAEPVAAAPGTR